MSTRKSLVVVMVVIGLVNPMFVSCSANSTIRLPKAMAQQLKEDVKQLASDSRYSSEQYSRAVAYVKAQAEAVGLKAEVEVEPVKGLSRWKRGEADRCEVLGASPHVFSLTALANSVGDEFEGEVVQVDYFSHKNQGPPPQRFDKDGKKRIVFFSRPLKRDRTLEGYVDAVGQRNHGASWAARNGAAAVVVRSIQTGDGPPHGGAVSYAADAPKIPAAVLSVKDADLLETLLKNGKVSAHLSVAPKEADREQANVVIRIPGTTLAKEIVLLSAHLDSHDTTPGAADDAAGVASVLAVMREFSRKRPARTVLIVLFADEEINFLGGLAFVKAHLPDMENIVSATEMDDGDGMPYALQTTSTEEDNSNSMQNLREIAITAGSEASLLKLTSATGTYGTDLEALWTDHGIPEVAILQDLSKYFDKHHAANDTPQNINWEGLERTTSLLMKVMRVIASGIATPRHRTKHVAKSHF